MSQVSNLVRIAAAATAVFIGLFWSGDMSPNRPAALVSTAEAIIGRPLTPMSYAGVARRTVRRGAVYGAPVYGAPYGYAPPPVVVTPRCMQVVNAYGQLATVCQ